MSDKEMRELKDSVFNIETALCGNESHGIEGLVSKVNKHDKVIGYHQKLIYIGIGVGFILGIILKLM